MNIQRRILWNSTINIPLSIQSLTGTNKSQDHNTSVQASYAEVLGITEELIEFESHTLKGELHAEDEMANS
jgi:hypothetical protein